MVQLVAVVWQLLVVCQLVSALGMTQAVVPVLELEDEELERDELDRLEELDRELELRELERELELGELERELEMLLTEFDLELELIELDLLEDDKDDERDEEDCDETLLHTEPVTTGFSAVPPFLST